MPDKKTVENGPGRDSGGRFAPGCSGGPGRPKGSGNAILTQARAWVQERGLPLMIEAAEAGDSDALRALVTLGMPRQKPVAAGLEGLDGLPLPERPKDLGRTAAFLLEQVAAGKLSTADAESVLSLAKRSVDLQQAARPISLDDFRL